MAAYPGGRRRPGRLAHRHRQDPHRVPRGDRRRVPGARGAVPRSGRGIRRGRRDGRTPHRHRHRHGHGHGHGRRLRLAAAGARRRRAREPPGAARGHRCRGGGPRHGRARHDGRGPHRRHATRGAGRDAGVAPRSARHDPRVALFAGHRHLVAGNALRGPHRHRGRGPHPRPRQAGCPPRPDPRTPLAAWSRRTVAASSASASRRPSDRSSSSRTSFRAGARRGDRPPSSTVATAATSTSRSSCPRPSSSRWRAGRSSPTCSTASPGTCSSTARPSSSSTPARWPNGSPTCWRSASRVPKTRRALPGRDCDGDRAGGPRRTRSARARRRRTDRPVAAGRRPPRQPVGGAPADRRAAPPCRRSPRAGRDRLARARHRRRSGGAGLPDRLPAGASRRSSSGSGGPTTSSRARLPAGSTPSPATSWSSAPRCSPGCGPAISTALQPPVAPLDVLAQQLVAEVAASEEYGVDALYELMTGVGAVRGARPRDLRRGGRPRLLGHPDRQGTPRRAPPPRRGQRAPPGPARARSSTALTNGGAIPETGDYRVVLDPEGVTVGSVHEDFAVEATAGDIFLLGTHSWRVVKVETGTVRVLDAGDLPPTIPFWLGEAPARTAELSDEVSDLRAASRAAPRHRRRGGCPRPRPRAGRGVGRGRRPGGRVPRCRDSPPSARCRLASGSSSSGSSTSRRGPSSSCIHPTAARINRALGLALRKRFCVSFDFELQAAADDDTVVISLGPQHSFPLPDVPKHALEPVLRPRC